MREATLKRLWLLPTGGEGNLIAEMKSPTQIEDLRGAFVFGGPGRNRTTDTRIFNPRKMPFIVVD
jgi:hypothetical protein